MASPAFAWWAEGHQIIAAIAAQRLNPKAKAAVAAILPKGQTLESIASWADDIAKERKETSSWHYINIPPDAPQGDWTKYCPEKGCVAAATKEMEGVLRSKRATRAQREEALRFLVHFIGDMHQPLHAGERHDHGGNLVKVTFNGRVMTLHAAWDGVLMETWFKLDANARAELRKGAPEGERDACLRAPSPIGCGNRRRLPARWFTVRWTVAIVQSSIGHTLSRPSRCCACNCCARERGWGAC